MENKTINTQQVLDGCNKRLDESVDFIYDRSMEHAKNLLNLIGDQEGYIKLVDELNAWKREAKGD